MDEGHNEKQTQDASVSSTAEPTAATSSQGAGVMTSGEAVASLVRRARKGFGLAGTTKKRLVLKLDDDAAAVSASDKTSQETGPETQGRPDDAEPWWKVEYQRPPPGHLGAHVVPVAQAALFQRTGEVSAPNMFAKRCVKKEEMSIQQRPSLDDSPGGRKRLHSSHETPERAHRRARGDVMGLFASVPSLLVDSSPTQKRKLRHVRDSEPRNLLEGEDDSVDKEQQRLHDARPLFPLQPAVVTPSRLVKPLTAIEIAGDAPSSSITTAPREAAWQGFTQAASDRSGSDARGGGAAA